MIRAVNLFTATVSSFHVSIKDQIGAEVWDKETEQFKKNSTKNEWIGCIGSEPIYRGYSCGLWTLFHYLLSEGIESETFYHFSEFSLHLTQHDRIYGP